MHNPQVKAIRIIELLLLSSALVLFVVGSILEDTFFLRLATEAVIQRSQAINQQTLQARQRSMLLSLASERMCPQEYFQLQIKLGLMRVKAAQ